VRRTLAAVVAGVAVLALSGCGATTDSGATAATTSTEAATSSTPQARYSKDDPEYQLAVIDGRLDPSDADVRRYDRALGRLQRKCRGVRRSRLADFAVVTKKQLEKAGRDITALQALRGVNKAIAPAVVGKVRCVDIFAAYATLVQSGQDS
jgi:hypothetical protein